MTAISTMLKPNEAAKACGLSLAQLRTEVHARRLKCKRLNRRVWLFNPDWVNEWRNKAR